jgi:hypothetical protein
MEKTFGEQTETEGVILHGEETKCSKKTDLDGKPYHRLS